MTENTIESAINKIKPEIYRTLLEVMRKDLSETFLKSLSTKIEERITTELKEANELYKFIVREYLTSFHAGDFQNQVEKILRDKLSDSKRELAEKEELDFYAVELGEELRKWYESEGKEEEIGKKLKNLSQKKNSLIKKYEI